MNEFRTIRIRVPRKDILRPKNISEFFASNVNNSELKNGATYHIITFNNYPLEHLGDFLENTVTKYESGKFFLFDLESTQKSTHHKKEFTFSEIGPGEEFVEIILNEFEEDFVKQYQHIKRQLKLERITGINFLAIINILNAYTGNALIKWLYLAACYYFLDDKSKVEENINLIIKYYPDYENSKLLGLFTKIVSQTINVHDLSIYKSLIITSYLKPYFRTRYSNSYDEMIKLINKRNWTDPKIDTWDLKSEKMIYDSIAQKHVDHVIFIGHGSKELGFSMVYNETETDRMSVKEFGCVNRNLRKGSQSGVLMLGCNPEIYLSRSLDRGNSNFVIHSDTTNSNSIMLFLFGFIRAFNLTYNSIESYYSGRLSVSITGIGMEHYRLSTYNNQKQLWEESAI